MLRRYPHWPASTIEDLVHWFEREATVHEVAAMTRQFDAHDSFDQFRRAHIAKVNPVLRLGAAVAVMALIVCLGLGFAAL